MQDVPKKLNPSSISLLESNREVALGLQRIGSGPSNGQRKLFFKVVSPLMPTTV